MHERHYRAATQQSDSSMFSPNVDLYFSPSQLEALMEITDFEVIQMKIDELNKQAYEF